jgi:tRNA A-37 threonylcarbamoyl transferase component Bud32
MAAEDAWGRARARILFELGRGGMGTVYLAAQTGPGGFRKLKAVKQLRADLAEDPHFVDMFLDEARCAARLTHPNIVQTLEVGFDGARLFIDMEYLEGPSLEQLTRALERQGRLMPRGLALWITSEILAGLHHAHELTDAGARPLSIVHRDVSPHNVILTYEGAVKVLDFGIAKAADAVARTRSGELRGKVTYMAPEQAFHRAVDRRADVFAAGVILWQLVTGRRLWGELADAEIFVQLDAGRYPSARDVEPSVEPEIDAICARAMAQDPEARFASAASMQDALEDLLASTLARPGVRAVAALVSEACGTARAAMSARVEEALAQLGEDGERRSVPLPEQAFGDGRLADPGSRAAPMVPDASGALRDVTVRPSIADPERTETRARGRGARARTIVALGAAAVASTLAARALVRREVTPVTPAAVSRRECEGNADCIAKGRAGRHCNVARGACVSLESPACHTLAEPAAVDDDRTIWLGSMFPTGAPGADQNGQIYERGVALAREDFARVSRGVPLADGVGDPRPLGVVACDTSRDPDAAARHLVDDVAVPAIIGFSSSQKLIELASSLFLPRGVLATSDGSSYVSTIPHPPGSERMVWRTTMDFWGVNRPAGLLVPQLLEPQLRAREVIARGEAMRIALVREDSLTGLSSSDSIQSTLIFNRKTSLENGPNFEEIIVSPDAPSHARAVATLLRLRPHVVFFSAGDDDLRATLLPLEDAWPRATAFRPAYLQDTTLGGRGLTALLEKHPDARRRIFGMYGPLRTPANLRFTRRYNESAETKLPYTMVPGSAYDAFYVLAYAAFVAAEAHPSGPALARAIPRLLPPGEPIEVGAGKIFAVLDALRQGRNVDLAGTATTLDFDLATGDAMGDVLLDCERFSPERGALEAEEIPVVYRASSRTWSGRVECPR